MASFSLAICHNTASASHRWRFKINVAHRVANQLSIFSWRTHPSCREANDSKGDDSPQRAGLKLKISHPWNKKGGRQHGNLLRGGPQKSSSTWHPRLQNSGLLQQTISHRSVVSDRRYDPSGGGQHSIMFTCHLLGNQCSMSEIKGRLHFGQWIWPLLSHYTTTCTNRLLCSFTKATLDPFI